MGMKLLAVLCLGALAAMIGLNSRNQNEVLPAADGIPSATKLPLDKATSQREFQTATFGLG